MNIPPINNIFLYLCKRFHFKWYVSSKYIHNQILSRHCQILEHFFFGEKQERGNLNLNLELNLKSLHYWIEIEWKALNPHNTNF